KPGDNDFAGATPAFTVNYSGPITEPNRTIDAAELSNYLSLRAYEIQRRQVELLQASVLQKQRLRREMDLLKAQAAARERAKAILFEEQRRRAAARAYAAEQARAVAEAAREKAEADAAKASAVPESKDTVGNPPPARSGGAVKTDRKPVPELPHLDLQFPPSAPPLN
ncbi:MAG TPA: hypothetical protein VFJ18_09845, partial [Pararhizobium sp.]|nr:hypothetical protein [Pararhizobium sp.]